MTVDRRAALQLRAGFPIPRDAEINCAGIK
jgi:hypothetical protein